MRHDAQCVQKAGFTGIGHFDMAVCIFDLLTVRRAEQECDGCGCELDPLYQRILEFIC